MKEIALAELGEIVRIRDESTYRGVPEPRIHTKLNDYPSYGEQMIKFCEEIGFTLMPWQQWLAHHSLKYKPDGRWAHPIVCLLVGRQNGKSTFMALNILFRIYVLKEKLQVHTAHKLTTSAELFYKIYGIIEQNPMLAAQFTKKLESKGFQELQFTEGRRYIVRANNSAGRGIAAPNCVHMDEVRDFKDDDVWSALRYTQMASPNPQTFIYTSAGDQHSIVLNRLKERAYAAIFGAIDDIGWFEYSAPIDIKFDNSSNFWLGVSQANPSLGLTIHPDNIRAVLNDPEDIVRTEVLTQWVNVINPVISASQWESCKVEGLRLNPESDTWLAIDLSPSRKEAALVASQRLEGDKFQVILLQTWHNPANLDDKAMANDVAEWVRKYPVQLVAYSARTASAVAARLAPAGIRVEPIDGLDYAQSCDELLGAISSQRLAHSGQDELTKQCLSAVKLPFGDGGWVMGRKVSNTTICGAIASALATHYATMAESSVDIQIV
jgi:phage terminase large subunit-like protein